jgi:heme exporter protein CcmD
MPDWLQNPHASFVVAAYGVALAGLFALLFFSWRSNRCRWKEWQKLQEKRAK